MSRLAAAVWIALVGWPATAGAQDTCDAPPEDCRTAAVEGVQPCSFDVQRALDRAANGALGDQGPALPSLRQGCLGGALGPGRLPCQLVRAFAWARTGWQQFCADACGAGARGPTRLGARCGIGLTELPEDELPGGVDAEEAATSTIYNAGAGAARLAEAWNRTPCVGQQNPDIAEHWYFAVWAADAYTFANSPNNPAYPVLRRPYGDPGSFDRSSYPFQEIVYGLAGHPPTEAGQGPPLWEASPVTLPAAQSVCGTAGCVPGNVASPSIVHDRDCPPFVPVTDGGGGDGGPDGGGAEGGPDAGTIPGDPNPQGCSCRAGGGGRGALAVAALWAALLRIGLGRRSRRCRSSTCSGPR